jgi:hypothetical protein
MSLSNPSIVIGLGNGTAVNPVNCVELFDGYKAGIHSQGGVIVKKYWCAWADSFTLANNLLGVSSALSVAGTITRQMPHACPESPTLKCVDVDVEPAGTPLATAGRPAWTDAIVTAQYGVLPFATGELNPTFDPNGLMSPDGQVYPFASISVDQSAEFLAVPDSSMKYAGGVAAGTPIHQEVTRRVGTATIGCTLHRVPFLPFDRLLSLSGRINSQPLFGRDANLVLFEGARTRIEVDNLGNAVCEIDLQFKYREQDWNKVPDPRNATSWIYITDDGTTAGNKLYTATDLRPLIFGANLA